MYAASETSTNLNPRYKPEYNIADMKHIIYIISLIIILSACTDESFTGTRSSEGGKPGELVPVELTLHTQPVQSPLSLNTKGGNQVASSTQVYNGMEISLVETPVTRATPEDEIKNFWVLQFSGTEPESTLLHKHHFNTGATTNIDLMKTGAKNKIIVIANAASDTFNDLVESGGGTATTLAEFFEKGIPDTATGFPLFHDATGGDRSILAGSTDMVVESGKQVDIMLYRTVARVKVELSISDNIQQKGYTTWSYQFIHIPQKSFYFPLGKTAVYPDASVGYMDYDSISINNLSATDTVTFETYLPVNLQNDVPYTTPEKRATNAPVDATYLQIMGLQMDGAVITRSVIYQIHLGSNLTDNYSISPNYSYNYDITLANENEDDSRVVKFIPGYFGGALKMYKPDGGITTVPREAEIWRYEKRIEVYIKDLHQREGIEWATNNNYMPTSRNDLMNGRQNTWDLYTTDGASMIKFPAMKACIDLTPGTSISNIDSMIWYIPSMGQSLGIYVAGSNTLKTLPEMNYWSSSTNGSNAPDPDYRKMPWVTHIRLGNCSPGQADLKFGLRCVKDLDPNNALQ